MEPIKLIILDDDHDVRINLQIYFEDEGFECYAFADSLEALEFVKSNDVHAGIIDLRIPNMTGEEFIIEASKIKPDIKFLIYTGSSDYVLPEELKHNGLTQEEVFHKPVRSMGIFVNKIMSYFE